MANSAAEFRSPADGVPCRPEFFNKARAVFVNARISLAPLTGVNRYLAEVLAAWPGEPPSLLRPPAWAASGVPGHLWEQLVLPRRLGGELLWSPVHSGPVGYAPQVVTVHDIVPLDHPEWLHPRFVRWYRWMLPRLLGPAARLIAVSGFTRDRVVATLGIDPGRIEVIPLGVNPRFAPADADAIERMRASLGLAEHRYVLSLGSLEPRKNLSGLLEGWRRALPRLPADLHLAVAGAAGRRAVFGDAEVGEWPPRCLPLGRVDDAWLPALYSGADCFAYLSHYEGFGLPPLEAMACGTPALVSDIEVFREISGDAALRAAPRDPDAIAHQLVRISAESELAREYVERGRLRAAGFRWEDTAIATAEVLRRVG
jgi:glycosyltransferase involved in cell wall biosynthesis